VPSTNRLRGVVALVLVGLVATACGRTATPSATDVPSRSSAAAPFIPQIISSESIVGANRFLFGMDDPSGTRSIGAPTIKVGVGFQSATTPPATIPAADATFLWAIPNETGVYAVNATFPAAGDWTALFRASGPGLAGATVSVQFQVEAKGVAVPIGGQAPSVKTPTASTPAGIAMIATDPTPDPAFYATSEDEALARHEPFVLVFATPALCRSRFCGPALDEIKAVAKDEPGITFINVEPYKMQVVDGRLQPVLDAANALQPNDAVQAFGILSEPWTFVVDRQGIVRGSFEAVISADELRGAIAAVR
jgi:hypothetical protein